MEYGVIDRVVSRPEERDRRVRPGTRWTTGGRPDPGGTGFLGRHLVEAALGDGHRVTLFNRGLSAPELFPEVEKIEGDREADLSALSGRAGTRRSTPAATCPASSGRPRGCLADAVDHYTFVSSISVYYRRHRAGV